MRWFGHRSEVPDDWEAILQRSVAHWSLLDDDEREALGELTAGFLASKRFEAAQGFELTDEIRTVIAAQACLLLLGLDLGLRAYHDVRTIIVHPTTMTFRQEWHEGGAMVSEADLDLLGETSLYGPVVIAWDAARRDARHPTRGHNVVLHEFAHKLDLLDAVVDGTPPLPDAAARNRWIEVCTNELQLLREGRGGHLLDPYGATDPGEFFAVATEIFFSRPLDTEAEKPELYEVLRDFYRQDPAARARR